MKQRKIAYIVSDIDKSLHFEWISPLLASRFSLFYILIGKNGTKLEAFLSANNIRVFIIPYNRKWELISAWLKVFAILYREKPDVVHTHLWIANIIGLTAAWLCRVQKRIYTRHHATLHHVKHRSGIKWDKLNNFLATDIIAISANVIDILVRWDRAPKHKVTLIHHGFNFSYFQNVEAERINNIRKRLNLADTANPVIGVISRFTEWKGVQYIIPAFAKLLETYPDAHLLLANAHGDYASELERHLKSLLPSSSFTCIRFENDLAALYQILDIFVHVPVDTHSEAFGQTYVEPLIAGIPAIFTLSGVASEFIVHEKNALVVEFRNTDQIYTSLKRLLTDDALRKRLIEQGKNSVEQFAIENYMLSLEKLYLR